MREDRPALPGSLRIATIAGIPIRIHWSFVLVFVYLSFLSGGRTGPLLVALIFLCVLLHELGHSLTARRYGVRTRDITLTFIGGVAMLDGRPTPKQEFWIALAGPLVNVVIAAGLYAYMVLSPVEYQLMDLRATNLIPALFWANVMLVLFNLLPAFPMDGGRILRSLISMRAGEVRGTQISVGIGQAIAILLGAVAIFSPGGFNFSLLLIAFFVFVGASLELSSTVTRSFLGGHVARDAMITEFQTLPHGANLEQAAQALLAGTQSEFPVTTGEEIVGMLSRDDIARGLATEGSYAYVAGYMRREFDQFVPDAPLEAVAERVGASRASVAVMEGSRLIGLVTPENLSEFIMLAIARQRSARA